MWCCMSANIFKTSVAALDTRKCCDTGERIHIGAQYSREKGLASSMLRRASGPLLEGDESGAVRGSDTGPTMLHRLVGDGELSQVVSNHLWDNDHGPEVGLDHVGLLVGGSLLLLLPQLLDQGHWLPLESPGELPPDPADKQLHRLLVVHVEELVEVDTPVGELPEGPPLLQLDIGVSHDCFSCRSESSNKSL